MKNLTQEEQLTKYLTLSEKITIQQDSREQIGKKNHILDYFNANNISVVRSKLFVGDYTLLNCQTTCIDVKKDVLEIANNICGKNHTRFRNELIRAKDNGIKLIVLIEENYTFETLKTWISPVRKYGKFKNQPYSKVNGETLVKCIITMQERYDVIFEFTDKKNCGSRILQLLGL